MRICVIAAVAMATACATDSEFDVNGYAFLK